MSQAKKEEVQQTQVQGSQMRQSELEKQQNLEALNRAVDKLVDFARRELRLGKGDDDWATNRVIDILNLVSYQPTGAKATDMGIDELLNELNQAALRYGSYEMEEWPSVRESLMDALSMRPSEVIRTFHDMEDLQSSMMAMQWLYEYCCHNTYVKRSQLGANPRFDSHGLIITINTAKPEFVSMKKAAAGNSVQGGYPKCTICHENEGFAGRNKRTLRTIPLELDGEPWFWQFSPYGYFWQHGICVNQEHTPMKVDSRTFVRLMDFVDRFPGYFIGCNAALPRIGGSVLAHDHYQGGGELLPMHTAPVWATLQSDEYQHTIIEMIDWQGSAFRVVSADRKELAQVCDYIRLAWQSYDNPELNIASHDEQGNRQSAVSPSVIRTDRGYEMSLILRNNAVSEEYPDGIFHAHPEYFPVKQEPIGLIEAQGLFILPGRLVLQLQMLEKHLVQGDALPQELEQFEQFYESIHEHNPSISTREEAVKAVRDELGEVCQRILHNTAVFKHREDLESWLESLGFKQVG